MAQQVNAQLMTTYWNIGRIIVEYEQQNQIHAEYGKQILKELSRELTRELGKGFSVSNIQFMRRFYQSYPIQQTASVKLSWPHYCELLSISDDSKRSFYDKILRVYVLIELKTKKLTPEVNDSDDNPPIGIILCTEKDSNENE